mgnify:CR=1 FL=1
MVDNAKVEITTIEIAAENPPKKYQDILPIYFESSDWKNLWKELLDVALFWIEECDIKIFRVDNPHTKPFFFFFI